MIRRWLDDSADPQWRGWIVISWVFIALVIVVPIFIAAWRPLRTCGG